jgi:hypothetical protein
MWSFSFCWRVTAGSFHPPECGFSWIPFDGKPASYLKVIKSVRLSVGASGFKGSFVMLPLR